MRVYHKGGPAREARLRTVQTLGEALRERRVACGMTQEFAAEALGVTRLDILRWENGQSDPNTSNLIAVARLRGVPAARFLCPVEPDCSKRNDHPAR